MKKMLIAFCLLCSIAAGAQDKDYKKGEKLYLDLKYAQAIPFFKKSYEASKNGQALHYLAYASLKMKDYPSALAYFRLLAYDKKADPVYYLEYGKLLKNYGLYSEAKPWFLQFLRRNPEDMEVRQLLKSCDMAPYLLSNPLGFGVEAWKHNTPFMEFSPVPYQNRLVYTSNRTREMEGASYGWDNMPFLRLMEVDSDSAGTPGLFSSRINGRFHVGPAVFNEAGDEIFFTRNFVDKGKPETDKEGLTRLKIMYSRKVKGKWEPARNLPFDNPEYSIGHPCLSADGNTLYFSSDMPGGKGGVDLWSVRRSGPDSWGTPLNLGDNVNTPGNEMFPTLYADTVLYFSSEYHPGLGGMDIFQSVYSSGRWGTVKNLGFPINSSQDDFGLISFAGGESGFISSNRQGGAGSDDVYRFRKISACIQLTAMDSLTYDLLPEAVVRITDGMLYTQELYSGSDGKIRICVPADNDYQITVEKQGYGAKKYFFSASGLVTDKDTVILAELVKGSGYMFTGKVLNDENDSVIAGALVKLAFGDAFPELTESDHNGDFDLSLDPLKKYHLEVYKDNFLIHEEDFIAGDTRHKVVRLRPLAMNKLIKLQNIYYDLDKADIRPEAAAILDTLVQVMKSNPYIRIEIGSHTDSRAGDEYNFKLSEKRAKAVIRYMEAKEIEPYRIVYKYYGETQLLRPCPDGVVCPEEDHQLNRRTEFKIIAF
jgi:outer membrane protein OmpA-like peptidoglycan-associated protein